MNRLGIIIANTGSPSAPTPQAVSAYLQEFLTDPRIRPMNPILWGFILKACILPRRSKASAEKYAQIWSEQGSPLDAHMRSLSHELDRVLDGHATVRYAMSYGTPSMLRSLRELRALECKELVIIPLYPQSAFSTTKVIEDKLYAALEELNWDPQLTFIERYWERSEYLDAIANSIRSEGFSKDDSLLMAFHSIPMKDVAAGDTYADQAKATAAAIADRLKIDPIRWRIGFQCRFDSRMWVGPSSNEMLQQLQKESGRLFVVAPNFSVDCLETLFDIDIELRNCHSVSQNTMSFHYVPCLNDSVAHVELVRSLIEGAP